MGNAKTVAKTSRWNWLIVFVMMLVCWRADLGAAETPADWAQKPELDQFLKTWLVVGPIPVAEPAPSSPDEETQKKAFRSDRLTVAGGEANIRPQPGLKVEIGRTNLTWQMLRSTNSIIDLTAVLGNLEFVVAYAYAEILAPEKTNLLAGIGSGDAVKIWLNGKLVHENWIGRPAAPDEDLVWFPLEKGANRLLLKIQNRTAGWGFACRLLSDGALADRLVAAAAQGNVESLQTLMARGIGLNVTNRFGVTPLETARVHGQKEIVDLLLAKGADPKAPVRPVEERLEAMFADVVKGQSAGLAALVARDGKILFEKGYGLANLEHRVPVTTATKFRIGSISKQFTAAAILRLQEQGKLNVQDKLSRFLPDYPRGDEVTLHHLLTHTSGIRSYTSKPDFLATAALNIKPADLIKSFRDDPFDFSPGEKWSYNNSGYFLLGHIIEKVSGESYDQFLRRNFFEPLGMKNTGVHRWDEVLEHEAHGYTSEKGGFKKALNWDMSRAGGAGALYSTVGDLFRWNEALFSGRVLSEASLKAAFTPVSTKADPKTPEKSSEGYGYGWSIGKRRGLSEIGHGVGLNGFTSYLLRHPSENVTVVVLANAAPAAPGMDPSGRAHDIAQLYLWPKMEVVTTPKPAQALSPKSYEALVGRYDYSGAVMIVTKEGDKLFAQLTGQPKLEIFPKSETEFVWKVVEAQVTFVKNERGEVTKAIHRQGGMTFDAPRMVEEKAIQVDPAVLDAYVGRYDYAPAQAVLTVTREGGRLFGQVTGQPQYEIYAQSPTEFFWKVVNARVTFVKDEKGQVIKAIHQQAGQKFDAPKIE